MIVMHTPTLPQRTLNSTALGGIAVNMLFWQVVCGRRERT